MCRNRLWCGVIATAQITVLHKPLLEEHDYAFARAVFSTKHGKTVLLYLAWRAFVTLLAAAPCQCGINAGCRAIPQKFHDMPQAIFDLSCAFSCTSDCTSFTTVVECTTGRVLGLFVEFRHGNHMHHFLTVRSSVHACQWLAC